jgi:hypothetical protein
MTSADELPSVNSEPGGLPPPSSEQTYATPSQLIQRVLDTTANDEKQGCFRCMLNPYTPHSTHIQLQWRNNILPRILKWLLHFIAHTSLTSSWTASTIPTHWMEICTLTPFCYSLMLFSVSNAAACLLTANFCFWFRTIDVTQTYYMKPLVVRAV